LTVSVKLSRRRGDIRGGRMGFNRLICGGGCSDVHEFFMIQNEKRGAIGGDGFSFAPVPEFAQNGERVAAQCVAALDAPDRIEIGGLQTRGIRQ